MLRNWLHLQKHCSIIESTTCNGPAACEPAVLEAEEAGMSSGSYHWVRPVAAQLRKLFLMMDKLHFSKVRRFSKFADLAYNLLGTPLE